MRFLFVKSDGHFNGDLLEMFYCMDCKPPAEMKNCFFSIGSRYPQGQCFTCAKALDGNTSAYCITIELNRIK